MISTRFFRFAVQAIGKPILIFSFALCISLPLRAGVDANGTTTHDGKDGKDGKSAVAGETTETETESKNWIEL